jgi:DNA-binding transcriptional LysR family regulator
MSRISAITAFTKVVSTGSFTTAAAELDVSKSHVSKRVAELEDRLGVRLLNRTTRSLALTEVGATFYDRCLRILADLEEAERSVMELQTTPAGTLRLSAPMTFGARYLAPLLSEFMTLHASLLLDADFSDRYVDLIDEGYDLALRISSALPDSTLVARKLARTEGVVAASPGFLERYGAPSHPRDLRDLPVCRYSLTANETSWTFERGDERVTVRIDGRVRANNGEVLVEAACHGLGVVAAPDFLLARALAEGRLVRILEEWGQADFALWAVYPHNRHLSAKVRLLVDFLAARLSPEPWIFRCPGAAPPDVA